MAMGDPGILPDADEQKILLDLLATLIRRCGHDRFIRNPIVEPTAAFFPDVWVADERGPRRMLKRLLRLGGFTADTHVELELFGADDPAASDGGGPTYLAPTPKGRVVGLERTMLADPHRVAGSLAIALGRVLVAQGRFERDAEVDLAILGEVAATYLGFGVLTANAALRVTTEAAATGAVTWTTRAGELYPQQHAFLLAAQLVARRVEPAGRRELEALLSPNEAQAFATAGALLARDPDALAERLGLPRHAHLDRPRHPSEYAGPLPGESDDAPVPPPRVVPLPPPDDGDPVFRVVHRQTVPYAVLGLLIGLFSTYGELARFGTGTLVLVLPVAGALIGRLVIRYRCSGGGCEHPLVFRDVRCPGCRRQVVGTIQRLRDRYDAEERWRAQHPRASRVAEDFAQEALAAGQEEGPGPSSTGAQGR